MRIKQITLSCCFLFFIACTQAEHDGQKNRTQEKRTDTVLENRQQKPDTKLLIPINKVTKSENILSDFAQDRILDLLNATDSEWIECKDEKGKRVKDFTYPTDRTSIQFRSISDGYIHELEYWKDTYKEIQQLIKSKNMNIQDLKSEYLVLNAYSLSSKSKNPISMKKVGAVYVSSDNKLFEIKLLDGSSAHIEVFKNIPNYLFESPNPEYELSNAPDYSPYYFRFWFDGDKEKQTCRLKYNNDVID